MTDTTTARFTVHMAPTDGAGVPLDDQGGDWFTTDATSAADAGRQVRAQFAGTPFAEEWLPWSVCDHDGEELWHYTDGPLEDR